MRAFKFFLRAAQAAFGVQSIKNMQEDFSENSSPLPFIIAGVAFTAVFVLTMFLLAQLLIRAS